MHIPGLTSVLENPKPRWALVVGWLQQTTQKPWFPPGQMCTLPLSCFWPNCHQPCLPHRHCGHVCEILEPKHLSLLQSQLLLPTVSHLFVFCAPRQGQPDCDSLSAEAEDPLAPLCRAWGICIYHHPMCLDLAESAPYLSPPLSRGCNNFQALTNTQDMNAATSKQPVTLHPSPHVHHISALWELCSDQPQADTHGLCISASKQKILLLSQWS